MRLFLFVISAMYGLCQAQTISIAVPSNGATIAGTVASAVTVDSVPALASIEWQLNGDSSILPARFATPHIVRAHPWSYSLKTLALPDGPYTIAAIARDALGNTLASDSKTFTIDNNDVEISLDSPTDPTDVQSGIVPWEVTVSGTTTGHIYFFVDGRETAISFDTLNGTFNLDTTLYRNGTHSLLAAFSDRGIGSPTQNQTPVIFEWKATFDNGQTNMELWPSAKWITLTSGETYQLTAVMARTEGTTTAVSPICSSDNPNVATVSNCLVSYVGNGKATITLTAAGKTATAVIFGRTSKTSPHFGKDGSFRTSYDPAVSHGYVKAMFGLTKDWFDDDATLADEADRAGLNVLEQNFFHLVPGSQPGTTEQQWIAGQDAFTDGLESLMDTLHPRFRYLLIGDGMLRQSPYIADAIGGPAFQSWTIKPITYAAEWARNYSRVLGIDMIDEVNLSFGGNPRPDFSMGEGLKKIVIASGTATATFSSVCSTTAIGTVEIVGSLTTGMNASAKAASCQGATTMTWATLAADGEYNDSGTGCGVSPCVAEPNLEIKIFHTLPKFDTTPETPEVAETAFSDVVTLMHAATNGRPNIAWPLQGGATATVYHEWTFDPTFSDYTSALVSCVLECNSIYPYGSSPAQGRMDREDKLTDKFASTQNERPKIVQTGWAGQSFYRGGKPAALVSINENVVTTSQDSIAEPGGKARVQGASDDAHNNFWYIGKVFSPTSFEIMNRATESSSGDCNSGSVTGEGGWTRTISLFQGNQLAVTAAYPPLRIGEHVTVSGCSQGAVYNREWIYHSSFSNTNISVRLFPEVNSTRGGIRVAALNGDYDPSYDHPLGSGTNLKDAFSAIAFGNLLPGFSGTRSYSFDRGAAGDRAAAFPYILAKRSDDTLTSISVASNVATLTLPDPHRLQGSSAYVFVSGVTTAGGAALNGLHFMSGFPTESTITLATSASDGTYSDATMVALVGVIEQQTFSDPTRGYGQMAWRAQANAWNVFQRIEPFLLQDQLPTPYYGWCLPTAARGPSSYGRALLVLNVCEVPITQTIDYSSYAYEGMPISQYRADWRGIRTAQATGTSSEFTIQPGELVALLFHAGPEAYVLPSTMGLDLALVPDATKIALRYAYTFETGLDFVTDSVPCSAGRCSPYFDSQLGEIWYRFEYLNDANMRLASSDAQKLTRVQ